MAADARKWATDWVLVRCSRTEQGILGGGGRVRAFLGGEVFFEPRLTTNSPW